MEVAIGWDNAVLKYCVDDANIERHFLNCKPSFIDFTDFKPLKELLKTATVKGFSEFWI
jgi:hypothetical protein